MWGIYITTLPIASLLTALAVSVVWIRITRRYARLSNQRFKEYETYLEKKEHIIFEKTRAVRELFFQVHHQGPRAAMASVLGLLNLYSRESKTLSENLTLLSRPNHHRYASLAIAENSCEPATAPESCW